MEDESKNLNVVPEQTSFFILSARDVQGGTGCDWVLKPSLPVRRGCGCSCSLTGERKADTTHGL